MSLTEKKTDHLQVKLASEMSLTEKKIDHRQVKSAAENEFPFRIIVQNLFH